jgi:hypothetical protein
MTASFGRFMSPDPAGLAAANPMNPQSWNRSTYVLNNPVNWADPLVSCPGNTCTKSSDLLQDRVCSRGPDEWAAGSIVMLHEGVNLCD